MLVCSLVLTFSTLLTPDRNKTSTAAHILVVPKFVEYVSLSYVKATHESWVGCNARLH
jgi:hypothetical protein